MTTRVTLMQPLAPPDAFRQRGPSVLHAVRGLPAAAMAALGSALGLTALLATGCAGPAVAPPFPWDPSFASPGKTLMLHELSREATSAGTMVLYRIESTGFSGPDAPILWWKRGQEYGRFAVALTTSGIVQVHPETDVFAIAEFVSGEPLDLALVAAGSVERAQAKVIPFPIEALGQGGCSASAELQSETGHLFLITLRGFLAGEPVHVESRLGAKVLALDPVASPAGELQFPVLFDPSDTGAATLSATGSRGSVTLNHQVGESAIVVR